MAKKIKYRYPGLNYFTEEDKDIFCGREDDSMGLYTQVLLSQTLVLHAESGTGKSSLIQAGLLPLIKKFKPEYFPITLRFDRREGIKKKKRSLIEYTINKITKELPLINELDLPYLAPKKDSLWVVAKKIAQDRKKKLLLIFDQFEEFQTFTEQEIIYFKKHLAELLSSNIPDHLYKEIQSNIAGIIKNGDLSEKDKGIFNANIHFLELPLDIKIIFVVREDKLGTMSLLSDFFPDILKNDFVLKPLSIDNARKAIIDPSIATGRFASPKFKFENPDIVDNVLNEIADNETGLIDPIQVQIVCSNIEKNVILEIVDNKIIKVRKKIVSATDIPPIGDIINDFYNNTWASVTEKLIEKGIHFTEEAFNKKRESIIRNLVVSDHRNLVHSDLLIEGTTHELDENIINILVSAGLMREIPFRRDKFYQLIHDRFIKPCNEDILRLNALKNAEADKQILEEKIAEQKKKEKRKVWIITAVSVVISLVALSIYINARNKEQIKEGQRILDIAKITRKSNPQLSLLIARKWMKIHGQDNDFNDFIRQFNDSQYAFLLGEFPDTSAVVDAKVSNSDITIVRSNSIISWSLQDRIIKKLDLLKQGVFLKRFALNGKNYSIVLNNNLIQVRNESGNFEKSFPTPSAALNINIPNNISISKDGKYILIGNMVYNYQTQKPIGALPIPNSFFHDQMASMFLNDSKHIVAGYYSGYKYIYNISEIRPEKIRITKAYPPAGNHFNTVITCIAVDSKDRYLIAGNRESTVEVWTIDSLNDIDKQYNSLDKNHYLLEVDKRVIKERSKNTLKGHSDNVNSVVISPNDSLILSGSKDHTAILWEISSGRKLAIMKQREVAISYTAFSADGNEMITATEDGIAYLWSRENSQKLYSKNKLADFTPFDYYNAGLGRNDEFSKLLYDTTGIVKYYNSTLNYIIGMPLSNQYENDAEYLDNIRYSLKEIDAMFLSLIKKPAFKSEITQTQKSIIYKFYADLIKRVQLFDADADDEDPTSKYSSNALYDIKNINVLLLDTSNIKGAIATADELSTFAGYFRDSTNDYQKGIEYLKQAEFVMNAFVKKYPDDKNLNFEETADYYNLSATYLYALKIDSAIDVANKLNGLNNGSGLANVTFIRSYLLKNNYDEAVKLFEKNENFIVREPNISLKEFLSTRLDKMKNKGVFSPAMVKFMNYLKSRKTPARLKRSGNLKA
jgi:WD40 repeat protein